MRVVNSIDARGISTSRMRDVNKRKIVNCNTNLASFSNYKNLKDRILSSIPPPCESILPLGQVGHVSDIPTVTTASVSMLKGVMSHRMLIWSATGNTTRCLISWVCARISRVNSSHMFTIVHILSHAEICWTYFS